MVSCNLNLTCRCTLGQVAKLDAKQLRLLVGEVAGGFPSVYAKGIAKPNSRGGSIPKQPCPVFISGFVVKSCMPRDSYTGKPPVFINNG